MYAELRLAANATQLIDAVVDAEVALVTDFRSGALECAWSRAKKLGWVHAGSVGVDALLFPALVDSNVVVTNASGVFDRAIAEYVLGMVLAFAKDVPAGIRLQSERCWLHRDTERIDGKRMLVVGVGSIGRAIARLARAVGLSVSGVARTTRCDDPDFDIVHAHENLCAALTEADFVVVAAPLTSETHHLLGSEAFLAMRQGARLINVGRGPLIDTKALLLALRSGRLAGAALDVFEDEPLPPEHPLWDCPEVMITAHMAGDFIGWRVALSQQFVDNFKRWCKGEELFNVVDKQHGYGQTHRGERS